jgi:hypothetical protein
MISSKKFLVTALAFAFLSGEAAIEWGVPAIIGMGFVSKAEARIGHPLTPLSYAGVARRTARRVARRTSIRLNTLPAGCVYGPYYGAYYYNCSGVYYVKSSGVYVQVIIE